MSASFYDLLKYAKTGIAAPNMNNFDKIRALSLAGGYPLSTITGVPPLTFRADGRPLISLSMLGNGQQTGTPTHDNPIMPDFCGKLVGTDWIIPIACAGQARSVYLGQVGTVRRIKKLVLTGKEEDWYLERINSFGIANFALPNALDSLQPFVASGFNWVCSHFKQQGTLIAQTETEGVLLNTEKSVFIRVSSTTASTKGAFKLWLADQYAAGTPVTIWYVLARPETSIVNEPLAKIGNYADELHSEDTGVMIPTTRGQNALTVGTDLQPSSVSISGYIKLT